MQAQKKLVRDRVLAVGDLIGTSISALTPHQAAVLDKKAVLVKRYSATEAMQIHAAAATAEHERGDSLSKVRTTFTRPSTPFWAIVQ